MTTAHQQTGSPVRTVLPYPTLAALPPAVAGEDSCPTTPAAPGTSSYRGRGARLIEHWTSTRRAAGLPEPAEWDGTLVNMAISLLTGRDVCAQGQRFALDRRTLLTPAQIELDITLGLHALGAVTDVAPHAEPGRGGSGRRAFRGSGTLPVNFGRHPVARPWRPSSVEVAAVRAAALSGVRRRQQAS